jgi:hypothetical protein
MDWDEWSASRHGPFTLLKISPVTQWVGSLLNHKTGLNILRHKMSFSPTGNRTKTPRQRNPWLVTPIELSRFLFLCYDNFNSTKKLAIFSSLTCSLETDHGGCCAKKLGVCSIIGTAHAWHRDWTWLGSNWVNLSLRWRRGGYRTEQAIYEPSGWTRLKSQRLALFVQ